MSPRHRLANRRTHEAFYFEHEGIEYEIGIGRDVDCKLGPLANDRLLLSRTGEVAEVFLNVVQKFNSPADVLVSDGAILMSLLLQHGCPISTIHHAMKRNPDGSPSSPLGRAAALIAEASDV